MSVNVYDPVNDKLIPVAGATLYGDAPVGSIIAFAGKEINLPEGYLAFNGQTVKRGDYPDLWAFAVANEQVGVDKFFSQGDGSTTFTLADLRETSLKGYGETSRTVGAHVKSGGLGIGEFLDDQLQQHGHANEHIQDGTGNNYGHVDGGNWNFNAMTTYGVTGARFGSTTEVKAVGVVWAVKAKQTGLPIDLKAEVEKMFSYKTGQATIPSISTSGGTVSVAVSFDTPMPDAEYEVSVTEPETSWGRLISCVSKTVNGFIINVMAIESQGSASTELLWTAYRIPH